MDRWQYKMLQDQLSKNAKNNPYRKNGSFKYEEGYKQGILASKSILSDFYHRYCEKEEK